VPKAGHLVPANYYSASYGFISDYISNNQHLMCRSDTEKLCNVGKLQCAAMNNCNGNGNCLESTGKCACNTGYKFADCSKKANDITQTGLDNLELVGPSWVALEVRDSKGGLLELKTNTTMDVYLMKGAASDPNNFVYDFAFRNVSSLSFNTDDIGLTGTGGHGFASAIYYYAYDEATNKLLPAVTSANFKQESAYIVVALASLAAMLLTSSI